MEQPFFSDGSSYASFRDPQMPQYSEPNSYPAFPLLLGSGHVPETLLYWNNDNSLHGVAPIPRPTFPSLQQPHLQTQHLQHQRQPQSQRQPQPQLQQQQQQLAAEQRKHKRTRSGCLTCRSRRVKVNTYFLTIGLRKADQ